MDHVFKEAEALERLANNKDLLLKISAYFVIYAEKQITELRDAFISDDTKQMFFLTHKLVGSLTNFGKTTALAAGNRLQSTLKQDTIDKDRMSDDYHTFIRAVEQLRSELAIYSAGISPPDMRTDKL